MYYYNALPGGGALQRKGRCIVATSVEQLNSAIERWNKNDKLQFCVGAARCHGAGIYPERDWELVIELAGNASTSTVAQAAKAHPCEVLTALNQLAHRRQLRAVAELENPQPTPDGTELHKGWCVCGDKENWGPYVGDGQCECGINKHHYHCNTCGGVLQVG